MGLQYRSGWSFPQLHSREEPSEGCKVTLRSWARYLQVAVFNAADLEGEALSGLMEDRKLAESVELKRLEAAEAVMGTWPVPVSFGGDRVCYLPAIDRIQLLARASFHSPAAFCATWDYAQIHSTGHESRPKRDLGCAFGKTRYALVEPVAELGTVLLKESPKVLFQVLSEARQAADLICLDPSPDDPTRKKAG